MHIEKPSFADKNLAQAIDIANEMFDGKRGFLTAISAIDSFDMSFNPATSKPFTGQEIATHLSQKVNLTVQTYRPWIFWSRANACTYRGQQVIHLNEYKLDRSVASIVNTLIHESIHCIDEQLLFSHGGNRSSGKDETAPYKIGNIAERLASI